MKKILVLAVGLLFVFVLGCVDVITTEAPATTATPTTAAPTTQAPTTTTYSGQTFPSTTAPASTTAGTTTTADPRIFMDLPDDEVEIHFWHIFGAGKSALLDELIEEFEAMYPNVTVVSTSQANYPTLRDTINGAIMVGQAPTLALGYPDHVATYLTASAVHKLDNYINSNVVYEVMDPTSTLYGEMVEVALDIEDFIEPYLEENNQYPGGYYYSLPYSKSTEAVAVNRTVLKHHVAEIRALGITISDNGFFDHDTPLTFAQLQALTPILVNSTATTDVANKKCAFLMNYDSSGNTFINISRQLNAPYTNTDGQILIDNQTTRNMLTYIEAMFNARTFVLPTEWNDSYGSTYFRYGEVCMTVGSSAGVSYNIPSTEDEIENLKFGLFDVDFIGVPQAVLTDNTPVTLNAGGTNLNFTGSQSAVQQGPNICIFSSASSNEKLFAWLLIKWLTTTENTARWAMDTGYLPVRYSAYTTDTEIQLTGSFSTSYKDFLGIAEEYWTNDGVVDWTTTPEKADYVHSSMVANIAANQIDYSRYDPAFPASSNNASSATARDEAGYCLEYLYSPDYNPEQALNVMISTLIFN